LSDGSRAIAPELSETASRPLIYEKDPEVRQKAMATIVKNSRLVCDPSGDFIPARLLAHWGPRGRPIFIHIFDICSCDFFSGVFALIDTGLSSAGRFASLAFCRASSRLIFLQLPRQTMRSLPPSRQLAFASYLASF
jgi:hypothetical protein